MRKLFYMTYLFCQKKVILKDPILHLNKNIDETFLTCAFVLISTLMGKKLRYLNTSEWYKFL